MKCTTSARVDNFSIRKANYGLRIDVESLVSLFKAQKLTWKKGN